MGRINLGKDYTVSGSIGNVSDLSLTIGGEKLDSTTRRGSLPLKTYEPGLEKKVFECTVLAEESTSYQIGGLVTLTCNDHSGDILVTNAVRGAPKEGFVDYKLTLTPGNASSTTITV
jgi:hypothetical protein